MTAKSGGCWLGGRDRRGEGRSRVSSAGAQATVANGPDYVRDPTRWGSAEVATHFPGFQHLDHCCPVR